MKKQPKRRKKLKQRNIDLSMEDFQDDQFFYIAGYTSGGAPYGVTWEEMELEPYEDLESRGV